jgi:HEAT repeat protein
VQEEVKRLPTDDPIQQTVCIDKPANVRQEYLRDTMVRGLIVPADERMEQRVKAIVAGQLPTLYGEDSRYYAIEALGYRPSQENAEYLETILNGNQKRLRWAAYEALQRMHRPATPPAD